MRAVYNGQHLDFGRVICRFITSTGGHLDGSTEVKPTWASSALAWVAILKQFRNRDESEAYADLMMRVGIAWSV